MKIYLLSQVENDGCDSFDSIIVAAETEDEARLISPCSFGWEHGGMWANSSAAVTIELIGDAVEGTEPRRGSCVRHR